MSYIFVNVIADGKVDWQKPLTAEGQPGIRECHMLVTDDDLTSLGEWSGSASGLRAYNYAIAAGSIVVGHSVQYHHAHLRAIMIGMGIDPFAKVHTLCTMLGLTGTVVKNNGKKGWPTFDEACNHFGVTRSGTESAEDNARCLLQVYRGMRTAGINPDTRIWKDREYSS
jgi:hypothetical protein